MAEAELDPLLPTQGSVFARKYVIERLLGRGGMGAVFVARHQVLGQRFAIKFLLGDRSRTSEAVQRFLNEAQNAATLQSEYVARVTDADVDGSLPYMVMEYLEGQDLAEVLHQRGALPVAEAVDLVLQALEGVALAHERHIIHRDLKPSNLFLSTRADGSRVVKVLDFGISKALSSEQAALTSTKGFLGSPTYVAPEQLRSAKTVDHRVDVWAMGVILYELVTNASPFPGMTLGEVFSQILELRPASFSELGITAPPGFEQVVFRCLEKAREHRLPSCLELAAALAPFAPPHALARPLLVRARSQGPISPFASTARVEGSTSGAASPPAVVESPAQGLGQASPSSSSGRTPQGNAYGTGTVMAPTPSPASLITGSTAPGVARTFDPPRPGRRASPLAPVLLGLGLLVVLGGVGGGVVTLRKPRAVTALPSAASEVAVALSPPPPATEVPTLAPLVATETLPLAVADAAASPHVNVPSPAAMPPKVTSLPKTPPSASVVSPTASVAVSPQPTTGLPSTGRF